MRPKSRVVASFSCAIITACTNGREVATEPRALQLAEIHLSTFAFVDAFGSDVAGGNRFYSLDGWR